MFVRLNVSSSRLVSKNFTKSPTSRSIGFCGSLKYFVVPRALKVLQARLYDQQREALDTARADARKSQVGSGDRSERIRTYNFPQGRVTDHRINLTLYNLAKIIEGEALDDVINPLIAEDQAARLAALEDEFN